MKKQNYMYMYLVIVFTSCLLISNIVAGRLFAVGNMVLPSAVLLFPITYIIGDVVAEVYGFAQSRQMIMISLIISIFASVIFWVTNSLPMTDDITRAEAYITVLGFVPRTVIASLISFFVGSISNAALMNILKRSVQYKHLYVRTILSTLVGEGLDTVIFIYISFVRILPYTEMVYMMCFQYIFKVSYEILFTPFLYQIITWVQKFEGRD